MIAEAKRLPWNLIVREADRSQVSEDLIAAIMIVSSDCQRSKAQFHPKFRNLVQPIQFAQRFGISRTTEEMFQKTSWGFMQIMGAHARALGFVGMLPELIAPVTGIRFGAMRLRELVLRYGYTRIEDIVSAYGADGTAKKLPDGTYANQKYVISTMRLYNTFREETVN